MVVQKKKKKKDVGFNGRLVAKWYNQIPSQKEVRGS